MNFPIKCAICGVVIATVAVVAGETIPLLADKIGPHVHPPHYHYEVVQSATLAITGTTTGVFTWAHPDRDASDHFSA